MTTTFWAADMGTAVSRQVRRAQERRASKPAPGPIECTSLRRFGTRSKGLPFSRMQMVDTVKTPPGVPNVFVMRHPTRATGLRFEKATRSLLSVFFPSLPEQLANDVLGH